MSKLTGLTSQEVAKRQAEGLVNRLENQTSRSWANILRSNILTPFNGIITVLAIATLLANGSPINSLFFIAMLLNIVVGIAQEVKAKVVLDRLAIMVKPTVKVLRDGKNQTIASSDVVIDDYIVLGLGDQVVADGVILWSSGLEIDESLLTGESDPIAKATDDTVLSGSFVTSGNGVMRVTKVGEQAYSARLATEAKEFKRVSSELIDATNKIMKWIARILLVVVPVLVIGQLRINDNWREAVVHTVAAIVGMIPEGLVLLTSMAFLLAVLKLARQKVLVQQLPAVETLARVNTLLLDKTGTLTEGKMAVDEMLFSDGADKRLVKSVIATLASRGSSPTNNALREAVGGVKRLSITQEVPFNSRRKWSAISCGEGMFIMGAPEIVLINDDEILAQVNKLASQGYRVLAIAQSDEWPNGDKITGIRKGLAIIALSERIRSDAKKTLQFFAKQGVAVKIISGDSPMTVAVVAQRVGIAATPYDARNLPDATTQPKDFLRIVRENNVFGRVRPEQKRQIAAALQGDGDVVAMTGDGVNDALALKKADLGIAMSTGSAATRSVAEVVLLDNKFSHLPAVLAEGRRVVANIERVANLFIIKNVYTTILALATTILGLTYPFLPAQMTVIGALSIGIPAFFLALAPNSRVYRPGFMSRVLSFSIPTGAVMAIAMIACYYWLVSSAGASVAVAGTGVSIVVMLIGILVLIRLSKPVRGWKLLLVLACELAFMACVLWPPLANLFSFEFQLNTLAIALIVVAIAVVLIGGLQQIVINNVIRRAE